MSRSRCTGQRSAVATLIAMLMLPGCVFWSGQYGVTHTPDGKTATLSHYGGADAEERLADFVRGYCGGPFHVDQRTTSSDGRAHGVTFECEKDRAAASQPVAESTLQTEWIGDGVIRATLSMDRQTGAELDREFDQRVRAYCGGNYSVVRDFFIVSHCLGIQDCNPPQVRTAEIRCGASLP